MQKDHAWGDAALAAFEADAPPPGEAAAAAPPVEDPPAEERPENEAPGGSPAT